MTNRRYLRRLHFISRLRLGNGKYFATGSSRIQDFYVAGMPECHFVSLALKLLRFVKEFQSFKKVGGWNARH